MTGEYCRKANSEGRSWGGARAEGEGTTNDGTFQLDRWAVHLNLIIPLIVIERLEEHVFATKQ
jgi:hypothetical protein